MADADTYRRDALELELELLTDIRDQLRAQTALLVELAGRAAAADTALRKASPAIAGALAAALRNPRVRKLIGDR